jgi:predicted signal transduction protein with EAL and GGDEF domain
LPLLLIVVSALAIVSLALLEAADAAMYHSKQNGRDRVSFASEAGTYASRTPLRWPPNGGEPCAE